MDFREKIINLTLDITDFEVDVSNKKFKIQN